LVVDDRNIDTSPLQLLFYKKQQQEKTATARHKKSSLHKNNDYSRRLSLDSANIKRLHTSTFNQVQPILQTKIPILHAHQQYDSNVKWTNPKTVSLENEIYKELQKRHDVSVLQSKVDKLTNQVRLHSFIKLLIKLYAFSLVQSY
jgi:hypothetical protein